MKTLLRLLKKSHAGYGFVNTCEIRFDPAFREACKSNACGYYGKCWMCPPDVGEIGALIARTVAYDRALVFQTVSQLEDSFDIEGMHRASRVHNRLIRRLQNAAGKIAFDCLILGAGACGGCETCARAEGVPCRHPGRAVIPLEAAGVDVTQLAGLAGLSYGNGPNTVTFFGMLLYRES